MYRGKIREMRSHKESCYYIAQHYRLLELTENDCRYGSKHEYQCQVAY